MENFMDLLAYTRKLAEKINYYDRLVKSLKLDFSLHNPFKPDTELIVIWVENRSDNDI